MYKAGYGYYLDSDEDAEKFLCYLELMNPLAAKSWKRSLQTIEPTGGCWAWLTYVDKETGHHIEIKEYYELCQTTDIFGDRRRDDNSKQRESVLNKQPPDGGGSDRKSIIR